MMQPICYPTNDPPVLLFLTRSHTNPSMQLQKMARFSKSQSYNLEIIIATQQKNKGADQPELRPTLKIFLFSLTRPCFSGMGWSVGKLFFSTSQIPYPLNLIVNSPNIGNLTKYTNNAISIVCVFSLIAYIKTRPAYIGSCACVVKIVVKCSFEYLSVVHHTRRHPQTINIMQGLERMK